MRLSYRLILFSAMAAALPGILSCSGERGKAIELKSEDDLSGLTISCTSGNYYERKYSAREDVSVFACNSEADAVQAIRQGLADVFVSDEIVLTKEDQKRLGVKKAMRGEDEFDVAFALRKGNTELKDQLDAFLASAPINALLQFWLEGGPEVPASYPEIPSGAAPLRCVVSQNMEPVCFNTEGGRWDGLDPDILRRFAASLGRPLEIKFQNLGSAVLALQSGDADVLASCLFATEERRAFMDFSIPYYKCHPGYFVRDVQAAARPGFMERIRMNLLHEGRWKMIAEGLLETVKITFFSILLGTLLGGVVCAARRSRRKWARSAAFVYSSLIQGTPTLVLLLIMFYVVFSGSGINASVVAIFTFALCFASSSGSIFDTAISSVPGGQTEAGLSLGFTPFRTFTGIVLPQAVKKGLGIYTGECIALLKSTSIVGYIAIQDVTRASDLIRSRTFDAMIPLLLITIIYFLLAWLIRVLLTSFFRKYDNDKH